LIDAYTQPFEISNFKDHYEEALRELVEAKINHLPVAEPALEKKPAKVVDLMDALRRSITQVSSAHAAARPAVEATAGKPPKTQSGTSAAKAKPAGAATRKPRSA